MNWTQEEAERILAEQQEKCGIKPKPIKKAKKPHKYHAEPIVHDGYRFDSKKEGQYYLDLKLRVKSGEVAYFLRQVPFHLPGNVTYRVDFLVFLSTGTHKYVDVKGYQTKEFIRNKKQVEALYPVKIEVV